VSELVVNHGDKVINIIVVLYVHAQKFLKMDRRESTASQETFVSLQQLDPSPIESPEEDLEKQLGDPPRDISPPKATHLGLSGSGQRATAYYCKANFTFRFSSANDI
jgi:hypothetical protein